MNLDTNIFLQVGKLLMNKHLVYGNGESRLPLKFSASSGFITWGCNAIYRDMVVDNLVAIDYGIQQEIYQSGYPLKNKCWFAQWEVLPNFDPDHIKSDFENIFETPKGNRINCVVQGRPEDGLYITWIAEEDMVEDIDFPKKWSAGNTALHLACQSGAEEVYMCGFDGNSNSKPLNNIYKGSKNYLPEDSCGFDTTDWDNQFKQVKLDFPKVKFIKI